MIPKIINDWKIVGLLAFVLGLAPYFPEPHLWGKLKWLAVGAIGMRFQDWFDLFFHGLPFFLLIRLAFMTIIRRSKKRIV